MPESDSTREGTRVCHVERAAMTATVLADAFCWLCLRWDDGSIGWARACDYCQSPSGHAGDPCPHCGYSRRFTTVLEQVLGSLGAFRPD